MESEKLGSLANKSIAVENACNALSQMELIPAGNKVNPSVVDRSLLDFLLKQ